MMYQIDNHQQNNLIYGVEEKKEDGEVRRN